MKSIVFSFALLFHALCCMGQLPVSMDRLEGSWHSDPDAAVFAQWHFENDQIVHGHIYSLTQGDTVTHWHLTATETAGETSLSLQKPGFAPQNYRLTQSDGCRSIWQNVQPDQLPTCITFEHPRPNSWHISGMETPLQFRHTRKEAIKTSFYLGGGSTRALGYKSTFYSDGYQRSGKDRTYLPGNELFFGIRLHQTDHPIGLRLEAGHSMSRYREDAWFASKYAEVFTEKTLFRKSVFYAGIMPEAVIGKKGNLSVHGGIVAQISEITYSALSASNSGQNSLYQPSWSLNSNNTHFGAMLGAAYNLPVFRQYGTPSVFARVHTTRLVSLGLSMNFEH